VSSPESTTSGTGLSPPSERTSPFGTSTRPPEEPVLLGDRVSLTTRRFLHEEMRLRSASTAFAWYSSDDRIALSVLEKKPKKGPRRRCGTCGLLFRHRICIQTSMMKDAARAGRATAAAREICDGCPATGSVMTTRGVRKAQAPQCWTCHERRPARSTGLTPTGRRSARPVWATRRFRPLR